MSQNILQYIKEKEKEFLTDYIDEEMDIKKSLYLELYKSVTPFEELQRLLSYYHIVFNTLFKEINSSRGTVNAEPSRYYLKIIEHFETFRANLRDTIFEFDFIEDSYNEGIESCTDFLKSSYGSNVPDDWKKIPIVEIKIIFDLLASTDGLKYFNVLIEKLYKKDKKLGKIFEANIRYKSFKNNILTWESIASDNDKKFLINNWNYISEYYKEVFGAEVKIESKSITDIENNQKSTIENQVILENKNIHKNIHKNIVTVKYKFSDLGHIYEFSYKNILLKGVPGTGKSKTLEDIILNEDYLNLKDHYDTNVLRINVHSASSNADLMQGIGISSNDNGHIEYKEKQGLVLELIERATFHPKQPFVLVLEEIQENSLNELIGDLIYLIEDGKRAKGYVADNKEYTYSELLDEIMTQNSNISSVKLPSLISKSEKTKRMIIPHNLYIFCTSNYRDDRKVIEDNLLRRFEVIEIYPKSREEIGKDKDNKFIFANKQTSDFLEALNKSIVTRCKENGEIHPDRFMIGHSIWLKVEDKKAFSRALLKVITEFKDVKDMHFDDFKKITKDLKYPFSIEVNYDSYEEWIKALQIECYDFLS